MVSNLINQGPCKQLLVLGKLINLFLHGTHLVEDKSEILLGQPELILSQIQAIVLRVNCKIVFIADPGKIPHVGYQDVLRERKLLAPWGSDVGQV